MSRPSRQTSIPSGTINPGGDAKLLSSRQELIALLNKKFPGDEKERTYLKLLLEGMAKSAIKGNVHAAQLLLRYAQIEEQKAKGKRRNRPRLKHL